MCNIQGEYIEFYTLNNVKCVKWYSTFTPVNGDVLGMYKGQVTKLRLSCYLVLLSIDSKTR